MHQHFLCYVAGARLARKIGSIVTFSITRLTLSKQHLTACTWIVRAVLGPGSRVVVSGWFIGMIEFTRTIRIVPMMLEVLRQRSPIGAYPSLPKVIDKIPNLGGVRPPSGHKTIAGW